MLYIKVWNSLPSDVTSASSLSVFKDRLKTYLFCRCYETVWLTMTFPITSHYPLPEQWSLQYGPSVNKEYLSQIQFYSIFSELPVLSNTVVIITVCVKVANSTFLVTNKRTKWDELSMYYLCMLFCKVIFDYWRLIQETLCIDACTKLIVFTGNRNNIEIFLYNLRAL